MERTERLEIRLTTSEKEQLKKEAEIKNTLISLLVRQKLFENEKLEKIIIEQQNEIQKISNQFKGK